MKRHFYRTAARLIVALTAVASTISALEINKSADEVERIRALGIDEMFAAPDVIADWELWNAEWRGRGQGSLANGSFIFVGDYNIGLGGYATKARPVDRRWQRRYSSIVDDDALRPLNLIGQNAKVFMMVSDGHSIDIQPPFEVKGVFYAIDPTYRLEAKGAAAGTSLTVGVDLQSGHVTFKSAVGPFSADTDGNVKAEIGISGGIGLIGSVSQGLSVDTRGVVKVTSKVGGGIGFGVGDVLQGSLMLTSSESQVIGTVGDAANLLGMPTSWIPQRTLNQPAGTAVNFLPLLRNNPVSTTSLPTFTPVSNGTRVTSYLYTPTPLSRVNPGITGGTNITSDLFSPRPMTTNLPTFTPNFGSGGFSMSGGATMSSYLFYSRFLSLTSPGLTGGTSVSSDLFSPTLMGGPFTGTLSGESGAQQPKSPSGTTPYQSLIPIPNLPRDYGNTFLPNPAGGGAELLAPNFGAGVLFTGVTVGGGTQLYRPTTTITPTSGYTAAATNNAVWTTPPTAANVPLGAYTTVKPVIHASYTTVQGGFVMPVY